MQLIQIGETAMIKKAPEQTLELMKQIGCDLAKEAKTLLNVDL